MSYTSDLVDEINVLILFDTSNGQEGLKVHTSAQDGSIEATKRLYQKGLITQKDGGYLTGLGVDAVEHAQTLLTILTTD